MLVEMFRLNILDINSRDHTGKNALYWAMKYKKIEIIKKLLEMNINPMVSSSLSAMNYAVYLDNVKIIKCLRNSGINLDEKDDINSTPLINAILFNKQNSIKYLIQNGANLENEDFLGNSAKSLLKVKN
jgi:ankyrin repeat protein